MPSTTPENRLAEMRKELDDMASFLQETPFTPAGGRERSLVITNLQQARLWAGEALKEMGYFDNNS